METEVTFTKAGWHDDCADYLLPSLAENSQKLGNCLHDVLEELDDMNCVFSDPKFQVSSAARLSFHMARIGALIVRCAMESGVTAKSLEGLRDE